MLNLANVSVLDRQIQWRVWREKIRERKLWIEGPQLRRKRWKSGHMLRVEITLTLSAHCKSLRFWFIFNLPAQTQLEHISNIACEYGNYTYKGVTQSFIILCPYSPTRFKLRKKNIITRSNAYSELWIILSIFLNIETHPCTQRRKLTTQTEISVAVPPLSKGKL